jgi:divalent metal cation (Fe/Co/Zn/Cd) transporter
VALKLITGILMMSVSVISEAIHSMIDLVAAVIANYSVRKSGKPATRTISTDMENMRTTLV